MKIKIVFSGSLFKLINTDVSLYKLKLCLNTHYITGTTIMNQVKSKPTHLN